MGVEGKHGGIKNILKESKKMTIFEHGNLVEEISLKCNM